MTDLTIVASGSESATVADDSITLAKMAGIDRGKILHGDESGNPAHLSVGSPGKMLVANSDGDISWTEMSGDATITGAALTIADDAVTYAKMQNVAANSVLVRNGNSSGVITEKALATTQILIGDGTGFTAAALSGDVTMTNAGGVSLEPTQTNITSIYSTDLIIGRALNDTTINFTVDDTIVFDTGSTERFKVDTAGVDVVGAITATGDITAYASDKRLKTNIEVIESPLEKINKLSGFTYDWDKDNCKEAGFNPKDEKQIGVFAQDVQEVIPEAVKIAPFDRDDDGNSKSGENYLTVQYEKIVPLLIESIKEQQKQIDSLKNEVELLKKK